MPFVYIGSVWWAIEVVEGRHQTFRVVFMQLDFLGTALLS
jgi:hypothetical protein